MKSFLFSVGNSSQGPVGYCARIWAESKEDALEILRAAIPFEQTILERGDHHERVEYMIAYFNPDAIMLEDIDENETEEVAANSL